VRVGSSPHTRGARRPVDPRQGACRIIPAYAGSTRGVWRSARGSWDHPRIRGEHTESVLSFMAKAGSSPHTRGAQPSHHSHHYSLRIIPAYAGSTGGLAPGFRRAGDHPRIRGEHAINLATTAADQGSSPHTRGALCAFFFHCCACRIIPAYAGSTRAGTLTGVASEDHPRIRGEHWRRVWRWSPRRGSSPHTRGAHRLPRQNRPPPSVVMRIIPAYAGSTASSRPASSRSRDHPRIRGEHGQGSGHSAYFHGSSPHTRGAQPLLGVHERLVRIIPAYAGSTPARPGPASAGPDHPRIRGEHLVDPLPSGHDGGSSPHTRGAQIAVDGQEGA